MVYTIGYASMTELVPNREKGEQNWVGGGLGVIWAVASMAAVRLGLLKLSCCCKHLNGVAESTEEPSACSSQAHTVFMTIDERHVYSDSVVLFMQVIMLMYGMCCARLYKELGNHRMAVSACLRGNDFVGAAESCEQEARRLTGQAAQARLQDAIKHYKKAKQHLLGFQLLQRYPELAKNMTPEVLPCTPPPLTLLCIHACTVRVTGFA